MTSSSQTLAGPSRPGRFLGPSLDKIIKNVAWRKHSALVSASKSALDLLATLSDSPYPIPSSSIPYISPADANALLHPLILAIESASPKITEPALDCTQKLISHGLIRCEIAPVDPADAGSSNVASRLLDSICRCGGVGDDAVELAIIRALLSAVRSPSLLIRGECLVQIVKSCYNVYLGSLSGTNQISAKAALAQIVAIVCARVEADSMVAEIRTISVAELLELSDKGLNEPSFVQSVQNFISEAVDGYEGDPIILNSSPQSEPRDGCNSGVNGTGECGNGESNDGGDLGGGSTIREDGFFLFKNLCKFSMKFSTQENPEDHLILRGKVLSLELLRVAIDNAGLLWRTNERTVNGLLKTALGVPPGSTTTLSPAQDTTFRIESVKCLVAIIKTMGAWMDQQLRIADYYPSKNLEIDMSSENQYAVNGEEGTANDYELHAEGNSELSEAATLEQRRAYKIEFQKGISLFNRKPSKGIEFLINAKKIGSSPEEVAVFLKNTTGLNETMIGDYLGEREEFPLKVMHAYVDSLNCEGMDFGQAIRFFLRGFRLPGEAQKIDRIMEKFAERYCKCNPSSFSSADTAYVLAYSVIMLNTDAHNNMVKDKMSKADFIRNNRGIDDGKDLPEEYLGSLYDQIVKNEIKMNAESSAQESKQANSINKLLGLDNILNLVTWKQEEEKALGANGVLIKHIQEQFKAKKGKSESVFYAVTDAAILRFMVEVCWAPMLAAFSMTLDQSDDTAATFQCLQGFHYAVHVTSVMCMQTQRDAFVTTVAKFTYLHCAADMKQKNVDAVKTIMTIAIEDGNYLQESWEHILTCLSRFEHLQLLGEGAPPDASFFAIPRSDADEKPQKSPVFPSIKKKGNALQSPAVMAVVRGGSYDSTTVGVNASGLVTPEQINNFISNLNLLDQIGNFELNHIFAHSQRLNSEAIVAFVKALCKVSMAELQSPTDPRVFSLTKIVEIAHYNMNRIRLVWTRIWNVLSDFFVSVGLSENLSVAIFVMDSLRQLAMKFLEREELSNYNFQNEFLRPFVIVMQKSGSAEIRELIVRCISQMVLSRVNNVKSGWKSVFMVFTTAAADERKNIVLLAFETMEKIVRDYFPYITETETTTFTDCVRCLITFTNSRFNSDVSLNAIAFLRFCAVKLAEGGVVFYEKNNESGSSISVDGDGSDGHTFTDKDDHVYFWVPLLTGLSKLTTDPRPAIRRSSLEVLFNILKDHGHLFSRTFWIGVYRSVIFPIFNKEQQMKRRVDLNGGQLSPDRDSSGNEENSWSSETYVVAAQCLVDIFVSFFDVVRSQLPNVVSVLTNLIGNSNQSTASTGVAALLRLTGNLGSKLLEEEWNQIFLSLKDSAASTLPEFLKVMRIMDNIDIPVVAQAYSDAELYSDHGFDCDDVEDDSLQAASYVVGRMKGHIAVQLLIIQVITELYRTHQHSLSAANIKILLEIFSSVASHAHELNSESILQRKLQRVCSVFEISEPPVVHFENESHQSYLNFIQALVKESPSLFAEMGMESQLVALCEKILQMYLNCAAQHLPANQLTLHWVLPLGSAKKEELAARTPLVVLALEVLASVEKDSFRRHLSHFFPLLVNLIRCEHSSGEVQRILSNMFLSCIGPIIMDL
ncbi:brefeldin A-inhibited guanine nucleotide-exchange protein 1 isoform X3 [Magnolia sinica]|uniref:brefeldin A-inhibited guanine nucleotide-exchange protein 1 isoform X3 n=1 Tax=Magnolia sinica TaxID=86752 RepID=UPI00265A45F0|nr:brefeldin A-inhibited guanine nucleotide-exchange protein 1 isoform X3 [Magnolia sinica]